MLSSQSRCTQLVCGAGLLIISTVAIRLVSRSSNPSVVHAQQTVTCAQWASSTSDIPPIPTVIDWTCAVIPPDFKGTPLQGSLDLYSWIAFLAVNWPAAQGTCLADTALSILTSAPNQVPPVWTTYLQDSDVFVAAGQQPANWCFATAATKTLKASAALGKKQRAAERSYRLAHLPPKVLALAKKNPEVRLFLHRNAKTANGTALKAVTGTPQTPSLPEILQATGDILVDQNGRWTRFTVAMDQDEYNYIMSKTLWTKAGQQSAGTASFPWTPTGAMEFKSAWKVLGAGDISSHFVTASAIVYNDDTAAPSPGTNPVTVGLVGLHITHKTNLQRRWIWSTFEQVENDTKSFYKQGCDAAQCPPDRPTVANPLTALELNAQGQPLQSNDGSEKGLMRKIA